MAFKFQVGDTVEVVKCICPDLYSLSNHFNIGHRGKVIQYNSNSDPHCYQVMRRNGNICYFNVKELKLIRRAKEKKNES